MNIEGKCGFVTRHDDIVICLLVISPGIENAPGVPNLAGDLFRFGAAGGSLEQQMFDDVGDAVSMVGFLEIARFDMEINGGDGSGVVFFEQNGQAVRKRIFEDAIGQIHGFFFF